MPPVAGKIAAAEETGPAEPPIMQPTLLAETTEDPETFEELRHIRKLLADVQAEFQPVTTIGPEVELAFDGPHPFGETFEEEEVIADRYAAVVKCGYYQESDTKDDCNGPLRMLCVRICLRRNPRGKRLGIPARRLGMPVLWCREIPLQSS